MADQDLGGNLARLRRSASLTRAELAERSGVPVEVIHRLEQGRAHSARLPVLHALANGLDVELTALLGDPPAVPAEGPRFVAVRRAVMPVLGAPSQPPGEGFSLDRLRERTADGWTRYHAAEFDTVLEALPHLIAEARSAAVTDAAGHGALAKALQLAGHVAVRTGSTDLALTALERAVDAAERSADPLLRAVVVNSVAWTYQRQGRLEDALYIALGAAETLRDGGHTGTADGLKVWGALTMSAATSAARSGDHDRAAGLMARAETEAARVPALPAAGDPRRVSVFSTSSVRIERVRLAVQFGHPEEALHLAKGLRLASDTPPSWRTWLLLDVARAHTDLGHGARAVRVLESLRRIAPAWMRHHTSAVGIVRDLEELEDRPPGVGELAEFLGVRGIN
ncbi:helix-turn-helix transcriptional regulator [Streptomyces sp. J2-1]|uniref:helix-turn-helix transcriptional regulator n=1 Tax=Streptomyces corallincola TaxID=2851888 RepID=UPI001C385921|nr:helix-turn-helix transcriptional regulator [Streptomyces corallincola]MBV2355652.1 helix-turn-helix transcriptional regulator [Streptomyces corallincola]